MLHAHVEIIVCIYQNALTREIDYSEQRWSVLSIAVKKDIDLLEPFAGAIHDWQIVEPIFIAILKDSHIDEVRLSSTWKSKVTRAWHDLRDD